MLHSFVRGTLLSWHDSYVGKKWNSLESCSSMLVLDLMERKKQEGFQRCRTVGTSNQIFIYVFFFLDWARVYIDVFSILCS